MCLCVGDFHVFDAVLLSCCRLLAEGLWDRCPCRPTSGLCALLPLSLKADSEGCFFLAVNCVKFDTLPIFSAIYNFLVFFSCTLPFKSLRLVRYIYTF